MVNNKVFKLKPQTNKLSSNFKSSAGAVSFAMDISMTVKKQDYNTYINNINTQILSHMLINSRNYKKNISNSHVNIQATNTVVKEEVASAIITNISITESPNIVTGEYEQLQEWPIIYP